MITTDIELHLLETLSEANKSSKVLTQRDLARLSGLSLGMTNMMVKRFVTRGWVKLARAAGRTWIYALTPEGFDEVSSRTYGFLLRTASTVKTYYDRIETFVIDAKGKGFLGIVYEAPFEIEFVFRYSCQRHGLFFHVGTVDSLAPDLAEKRHIRVGSCIGSIQADPQSVCIDVDVARILSFD